MELITFEKSFMVQAPLSPPKTLQQNKLVCLELPKLISMSMSPIFMNEMVACPNTLADHIVVLFTLEKSFIYSTGSRHLCLHHGQNKLVCLELLD